MSTETPDTATPAEATESPAAEVETTDTTPDIAAEVEKWKALARKNEARAKENADKAKRLDEIEEASKSELEKAQQRLAELEQSANAATLKALRAEVANESGVPASLLIGDTEEALRESAAALLAYKGATPKAPTSDGQGTVGKPISTSAGQVTESEFRSMSPAEINVALREGRLKNILGTS